MIDRGRLGAEYSGVRRMKNGGAASSGTSLKDAYGQAASSMRAAGVTSVSGANTTQAAKAAVAKAAAAAKAAPEIRTMAYNRGNMVQVREDDDRSAAASPAPAPAAAAAVSAASKGPVPVPPPRPTAQPGFLETLKSVPGAIARDLKMGYNAGIFRNRDTQRENLLEAGYTPAQIDDYFARTDATIARNEAEAAARSDRDDRGIMSLPGSPSATPVASAEELARLFSEGQDITGKTQADLQPLVEQFLRGRGITDFGTYMPKIFETLQVPLAPAVAQTPLPPAPVFVAPTNVMGSQPAAVAPNFVSPAPVTPAPVIPPFVPITPVGQTGAYSPPPFAPITRAEGGPVDKIPGVRYMQEGGPAASVNQFRPKEGFNLREVLPQLGLDVDDPEDFATGVQLLYGSVGSNVDVRDWNKILSSSDPLRAAQEATRQMYSTGAPIATDPRFYSDGQYTPTAVARDYDVTDVAGGAGPRLQMYDNQLMVVDAAGLPLTGLTPQNAASFGVTQDQINAAIAAGAIRGEMVDRFQGAGYQPYDTGSLLVDYSGMTRASPAAAVSQPAAAQPAVSQPAAAVSPASFITPVGQAGPSLPSPIPLPTITPVGQTAAYSPPPLPAAPSYGMTPSGQPAYSPYGQTLPFSFPQLSVPQLTPSFFQYLPPLPQNQPLV